MATTLTEPRRLIEYPDDLSECRRISYQGRDLLYYLVEKEHKGQQATAIVVLGYKSGEKMDIITKDLIETIDETERDKVRRRIGEALRPNGNASILFI